MLGKLTTIGAVWTTGQSVAARLLAIVANLVLAWFLTREDFGLFGTAATIAAFCEVFSAGGIGTVLIVRQNQFKGWAGPAQWLSAAFGIGVAILMIAAGIVVANFGGVERKTELLWLVVVMALTPLLRSFAIVPYSKMRIDMEFKNIAIVDTTTLLISTIGKIAMAILGFGAFSFVIPTVLAALIRTIAFWQMSRLGFSKKIHLARWKYLLNDSLLLVLTAFAFKLVTYGDYAVLVFFVSTEELGTYFFAFTYSILGVVTLTSGLNAVLVPAFARLKEPSLQLLGFVRSAKLLMAIVCPLCLLQSAVSESAVNVLLRPEWKPVIPLLQILSLGMAGRTISWIAASLMESQGRFKARMIVGFVSAAVFLSLVFVGVNLGGILGTAIAVALFYPLMSMITCLVAIKDLEKPVRTLAEICVKPVAASAVAVGAAWLISFQLSQIEFSRLVWIILLSLLFYGFLFVVWMRETFEELSSKFLTIRDSLANKFNNLQVQK